MDGEVKRTISEKLTQPFNIIIFTIIVCFMLKSEKKVRRNGNGDMIAHLNIISFSNNGRSKP
jgi:hypothetical protein